LGSLEAHKERYGYRDNKDSIKQLKKFDSEKLKQFNNMVKSIERLALSLENHPTEFKESIKRTFAQYLRNNSWTWKNDMAGNEERGYHAAADVLNSLLGDSYLMCKKKTDRDRYHYRRYADYDVFYKIFSDKSVCNAQLGRFREQRFQWSKRGLVDFITNAVKHMRMHTKGETPSYYHRSNKQSSVNIDQLRENLKEAEINLLKAKLKYETFKRFDYREHPKFKLAQFLGINVTDMLELVAPNAFRELAVRAEAVKRWYDKEEPKLVSR